MEESFLSHPIRIRSRTLSSLSEIDSTYNQYQEPLKEEQSKQRGSVNHDKNNGNSMSSRHPHPTNPVPGQPPIDAFSVRSSYSEIPPSTLGESTKSLSLAPYNEIYTNEEELLMNDSSTILKSNLRIRVVNENSKRFKDLLVPIVDDVMLFDAVYENPVVKKAHVRKWGAKIVALVKAKDAEIKCSVWDDVVESPCYTFTIDELKETSTRQLYQLVPESDLIKLVLQCVETAETQFEMPLAGGTYSGSGDGSHGSMPTEYEMPLSGSPLPLASPTVPSNGMESLPEPEVAPLANGYGTPNTPSKATQSCSALPDPDGDIVMPLKKDDASVASNHSRKRTKQPRSLFISQPPTEHSPTPSNKSNTSNSVFRCPFSGIAVDNSIFKDLESQMARHQSHSNLESMAPDYQEAFKKDQEQRRNETMLGNGGDVDRSMLHTSERQNSARFMSERSSSSSIGVPPHRRQLSPAIPASIASSNNSSSRISSAHESDGTIMSSESPMQAEQAKTTMRVRITNEASNRFKDLVVNVRPDLNLYESIYEHQAVKSAHVRKWGTDVVKNVKNNISEIHCVVLDGLDGDVCRTYTVDDLKETSTQDLLELAPSSDPIRLVLRCSKKKKRDPILDVHANFSLGRERAKLQAQVMKKTSSLLTSSKSDSCFGYAAKKLSRPNHMNLSTMKNASFAPPNGSNGRNNLLTKYGANDLLNRKVGFQNGVATSVASDSKSAFSADDVLRRRRGRNGSQQGQDSLTSLSEVSTGHRSEMEDSDRTLTATGTKPFANGALAASKSSDSLDPLQLLQKYTKAPQTNSMWNLSSHSNDEGQIRRGRRRALKSDIVNTDTGTGSGHEKQIKEFMRLCRGKKGWEHQSSDQLGSRRSSSSSRNGSKNASFPALTPEQMARTQTTVQFASPPVLKAPAVKVEKSPVSVQEGKLEQSNSQADRINRFLRFSAQRSAVSEDSASERLSTKNEDGNNSRTSLDDDDQNRLAASFAAGVPPIAEIAVYNSGPDMEGSATMPGISLSGDLVKEVFPYHIVFDEQFRIQQVGNSLSLLVDGCPLVGQCVSDLFQITGPIPTFGEWDWLMLDKMKDNTVFLESVAYNSSNQKARIKGTIIELSKSPRQVMLALFPNVKNLSELEDMNLSMVDLPLHSCQREAVLLGEHSKSEVKLTNHLDQLHRDLINSMEKQIEDRTTELATANHELEDANNQLARQSARQLEHFACMSHEIRTPLNCIVGMSSLLLEDCEETEMDPMHADSIKMIHTSGELLKAVVDDVLDYAKLESGAFLVDIKPTRLQDALDSVVHSISQKVQEKNIRLRTHYSPTLPEMLETDSRRLQQVLFNLLGNAGKFSKADSVIDLTVKLVHANEADPTAQGPGSMDLIRFSVKDYGKGIDSKDFEKIFKPFSQASKETQNVYGGTGLGLSITSKLVKRLGGRISVDSELDKFAEFTVDLPMNPEFLVDVTEVSQHLEKTTIVLVDTVREYDYSFTSNEIPGEPDPLSDDVSKVYGLNVLRYNTLEKAYESLKKQTTPPQHQYAFLVHENLYSAAIDEKLVETVGKDGYTILTHGPNYMVQSTKKRHFKSLSGVFPVTLLSTIAHHITVQEDERDAVEIPPPATGGGLFAALAQQSSAPTTQENAGSDMLDASVRSVGVTPNASIRSVSADEFVTPTAEAKKLPKKYNLKVLYAEDNLVNQKVLSRVLNRAGIRDITIVDNGKKAVDLCATTHFDCIFMDMQMPIMDGMEATKIIMDRDPNSKVIFVTAHALDEFKHRADSVGATSFISKPFRVSDIEAVLEKTGICLTSAQLPVTDPEMPESRAAKTKEPGLPSPTKPSPSTVKPLLKALTDNKTTPNVVKPLFDALGGSNRTLQEKVKPLFESLQEHDEFDAKSLPPLPKAKRASSAGRTLFDATPSLIPENGGAIPGAPVGSPDLTRIPSRSQSFRITPSSSFRAKKEAPPTRTLKVLYAEDNLINQKVLSRVLNRTGISDITIVDNGQKAVDITKDTKFDVIFMDYEMPIMDGMGATKLIMERDPESKIIFVTAHALEEYKKKAFALGATSFLSKPVKAADIEGVLQKLGM